MKSSESVLAFLPFLVAATTVSAQGVVAHDVDYVQGVDYEDGKDLLDIYMPEGAENAPVMVFFHGGAFSAPSGM